MMSQAPASFLRTVLFTLTLFMSSTHVATAQVPSTSPAFTSSPTTSPTPTSVRGGSYIDQDSWVYQVRREDVPPNANSPCVAGINDTIWIDVWNLDKWLDDPDLRKRLMKDGVLRERDLVIGNLVPFLNGIALSGIHPEYYYWEPGAIEDAGTGRLYHLRFTLKRNEASKEAWTRLLNQPVLKRPMGVSVGFERGEEMSSTVLRGAKLRNSQFALIVIPTGMLILGSVLILCCFVVFVYLARRTDIIRDTTVAPRPDGRWPYSLARSQMAFWFFLVIASYFFLWMITGDKDTITASVLTLIGISAGTALGAAIVDAGSRPPIDTRPNMPAVNLARSRADIVEQLKEQSAKSEAKLEALEQARGTIPKDDEAQLARNEAEINALRARLDELKWQLGYFDWPAWKGVMYDLLGENNIVSFHRFQIFVWTLVLGIIFCTNVYHELAMPEFNATLLGLLGLSAGTYIGFKLPAQRTQ